MDYLKVTLVLLAMISVLVIAHEWGHFIVARIFKIRVDDFSVGFGPRILRVGKLGATEYNIRAFPLGGFVKIAGMSADEAPLIKARDSITGATPMETAEAPSDQHDKELFSSRPIWQRSLVILGGPVMSFVFGVMVFCLAGCTVGVPGDTVTNRIAMANPGGAAYKIGLRSGDVIRSINNKPIYNGEDLANIVQHNYGCPLTMTVSRGTSNLVVVGTPQQYVDDEGNPIYSEAVAAPNAFASSGLQSGDLIYRVDGQILTGNKDMVKLLHDDVGKQAILGISRDNKPSAITVMMTADKLSNLPVVKDTPVGMLKVSLALATVHLPFVASVKQGLSITSSLFAGLAAIFQPHHTKQLRESTGGIVMMYSLTGLAVRLGLSTVVLFAGQISISLAIFNILPIPVLDGGHLLSYFIEAIRRGKKMNEAQQQAFLLTGMAVIGVLFVLVFTNDIHRLITHQIPQ